MSLTPAGALVGGGGGSISLGSIAGALIASQLPAIVDATKFASGIEPLTIVTGVLPTTKSTSTIFRTDDSKTYRWDGAAYVATVPTSDLMGTVTDAQIAGLAASKVTGTLTNAQIADVAAAKITGQVVASQIADATLTTAKFANDIEPVSVVTSVPTTKLTSSVFNSTDGKLYRWSGTGYVATVAATDLAGALTSAQIESIGAAQITGQLVAAQIADAVLTTAKFASGIEPVSVVTSVPTTKLTSSVFNSTDGKLYRWNGTAYTTTVLAVDVDARGVNIKIMLCSTGCGSDGYIDQSAYLNLNGNNVLLSDLAASNLTPTLSFVGSYATAPTQAQLGSQWLQNAVYRNATDGFLYVLTGAPLGWLLYLQDGTSFVLTIESTNGTVFRVGKSQNTLLKARLFKNGAEVTDVTPPGWFRWRRVSGIPRAAPNDDATWNNLYVAGYKQVSINVDDVYARATFFCDILES